MGDRIRNMTGTLGSDSRAQSACSAASSLNPGTGVFARSIPGQGRGSSEAAYSAFIKNFDASLVVPVGSVFAPRAWGALPCCYLGHPGA